MWPLGWGPSCSGKAVSDRWAQRTVACVPHSAEPWPSRHNIGACSALPEWKFRDRIGSPQNSCPCRTSEGDFIWKKCLSRCSEGKNCREAFVD